MRYFVWIAVVVLSVLIYGPSYAGQCSSYNDANSRELGGDDIETCSCEELRLLRNEIFARHGRVFDSKELQNYFGSKPWYKPGKGSASGSAGQNKFEKYNVSFLKSVEDGKGCGAKVSDTVKIVDSEDFQILSAARDFVDKNSVPNIKYKLKITNKVGKWALVEVIPLGQFDGAGVILEKVEGKWVGKVLGTDFSDWEQKVPELFKY